MHYIKGYCRENTQLTFSGHCFTSDDSLCYEEDDAFAYIIKAHQKTKTNNKRKQTNIENHLSDPLFFSRNLILLWRASSKYPTCLASVSS